MYLAARGIGAPGDVSRRGWMSSGSSLSEIRSVDRLHVPKLFQQILLNYVVTYSAAGQMAG
jgi:hypothetical protein